MSYSIFRTNGSLLTTIPDGTVNTTSTPLSLPGRNYASYGQLVDTNFIRALENFADTTPPSNAMKGQLWYDTTPSSEGLYLCPTDGETDPNNWVPILTPDNIGNLTVINLTATSNVTANNATITNNANANAISTNYLTVNVQANIANANITGNAVVANLRTVNVTTGSSSITGTLTGAWTVNGNATVNSVANTALYVSGGNLVTDSGIKTDNYYYSNGTPVSFNGTYTNSNVGAYLPTYVGNVGEVGNSTIFNGRTLSAGANTTTGTITGNWTLSTGSKINGISEVAGSNVTGTVANATYATTAGSAGSATTAATVTTNAQPNITSVGTLANLNVSGNANFTGQLISLGSNGTVSLLGGSAGQVLSTNGSGGLSWTSAAAAETAITVTANAQPNITSTGTLTGLTVSGNASFTGANVSLGDDANLKITGGTSGEILTSLGSGNVAWQAATTVIPSGTRMIFAQTNAPTGWVKDTTNDNAALRVVSGTAGTGGSVNFTAAFTSQAVSGTVGDTTAGGTVNNTSITASIGDTSVTGTVGSTIATGSISNTTISIGVNNTTAAGTLTSTTSTGTIDVTSVTASIGDTSATGVIVNTTAGGTVGTTVLTEGQLPSHRHYMFNSATGSTDLSSSPDTVPAWFGVSGGDTEYSIDTAFAQSGTYGYTNPTGGNEAHGHTFAGDAHTHTFSPAQHTHVLTQSPHSHTFSSTAHTHTFNGTAHNHTLSQTAHGHTFTGDSHNHTFSSPNHTHAFTQTAHNHTFTGTSHNHSFSGTAIDLAVKYVDTIIATKS